eukprot:COSAG02_NODE_2411_length_8920_cov_5.544496_1_plen_51_part_10
MYETSWRNPGCDLLHAKSSAGVHTYRAAAVAPGAAAPRGSDSAARVVVAPV